MKNKEFQKPEPPAADPLRPPPPGGRDPLSFESLVRVHERRLLSIAYQICGNLEDAKDIVQDAFLRAFRYRGGFRRERRVSSWLNRIAVNAALDMLRKRGPVGSMTVEEAETRRAENLPGDPSPEEQLRFRESAERVFALLDGLAPRERAAFVLRFLQGMPTAEVARSMGCTRVTVRRHSTRARRKLRRALSVPEGAPEVGGAREGGLLPVRGGEKAAGD